MAADRGDDGGVRANLFAAACLFILIALAAVPARAEAPVRIFAAASTIAAVNDAVVQFKAQTGIQAAPVYASSGALARQLAAGAPGQVFLSANKKWMAWAEEQGAIDAKSRRVFLLNRLVLAARPGTAPKMTAMMKAEFLKVVGARRIAIADPAHAPLGAHTRDALSWLGVWKDVGPKALRMSDAARARALVERGEAGFGILYESDVKASARLEPVAVFPAEAHKAIEYEIALTRTGKADQRAVRLLNWLTGKDGRAIFIKYGFRAD
jgi:molybdate transport system substrate-binding protein